MFVLADWKCFLVNGFTIVCCCEFWDMLFDEGPTSLFDEGPTSLFIVIPYFWYFCSSNCDIECLEFWLINGFDFYYFGTKLYSNSSRHSILLNWSLTNIFFIKSSVFLETFTFIGKVTVPSSIRFMSLAILLYSKGQNPYSISYRTTPNDQISAFIV